jgi:hypothetical protein
MADSNRRQPCLAGESRSAYFWRFEIEICRLSTSATVLCRSKCGPDCGPVQRGAFAVAMATVHIPLHRLALVCG